MSMYVSKYHCLSLSHSLTHSLTITITLLSLDRLEPTSTTHHCTLQRILATKPFASI